MLRIEWWAKPTKTPALLLLISKWRIQMKMESKETTQSIRRWEEHKAGKRVGVSRVAASNRVGREVGAEQVTI